LSELRAGLQGERHGDAAASAALRDMFGGGVHEMRKAGQEKTSFVDAPEGEEMTKEALQHIFGFTIEQIEKDLVLLSEKDYILATAQARHPGEVIVLNREAPTSEREMLLKAKKEARVNKLRAAAKNDMRLAERSNEALATINKKLQVLDQAEENPTAGMKQYDSKTLEVFDPNNLDKSRASKSEEMKKLLERGIMMYRRDIALHVFDIFLMAILGFVLGTMFPEGWEVSAERPQIWSILIPLSMGIGLVTGNAHLRAFGKDRIVFWRESASGLTTSSFFIAQNLVYLLDILLKSAFWVFMLIVFTRPRQSFLIFWNAQVAAMWAVSGFTYVISTNIEPTKAFLAMVTFMLIFAGVFGGVQPNFIELYWDGEYGTSFADLSKASVTSFFGDLSYARWYNENVVVNELLTYESHIATNGGFDEKMNLWPIQDGADRALPIRAMFGLGVFTRIIAFFSLEFRFRDKRV